MIRVEDSHGFARRATLEGVWPAQVGPWFARVEPAAADDTHAFTSVPAAQPDATMALSELPVVRRRSASEIVGEFAQTKALMDSGWLSFDAFSVLKRRLLYDE